MKARRKEFSLFLINFLKNPLRNASVIPSSATASRMMLEGIDFSRVKTVLELGPGNGTFTQEILRRCQPDTKVILIELETSYLSLLKEKFQDRVIIEHTSAHLMDEVLKKHGIAQADVIVSGLPFLPKDIRNPMYEAIKAQTARGAAFRFFTYMPPIMKLFYQGVPIEEKYFVLQNIPPMWIYGIN
jgi:phosphatidylethanolamine/phosphatidyl-N-methylethanolamine N-methyltransferase